MFRNSIRCVASLAFAALLVPCAFAQTTTPTFDFQVRVTQGQITTLLSNNGTLTLAAPSTGKPVTATVTVTYTGATTAALSGVTVFGSTEFTAVNSIPTLPATLSQGQTLVFQVNFAPLTGTAANGVIQVPYMEAGTNSSAAPTSGNVTINLAGTTPNFIFAYSLQANNNSTPLAANGVITFPATTMNSTASATFAILNNGSGQGTVSSISVTGAAFTVQNLPLLPATIAPSAQAPFMIQYAPTAVGTNMGTLQVVIGGQATFTFNLQGSSVGPTFSYAVIQGGTTTSIVAGATVTFPNTAVGAQATAQIQVSNSGSGIGMLNAISSATSEFAVSNAPALPASIAAGASVTFTVTFVPAQIGQRTGMLQIGATTLLLQGVGDGVRIVYSYGSGQTPVAAGGTVIFPPAQIGQSSTSTVVIQNTGTLTATINNIGINGAKSVFQINNPPALPATIAANASLSLTLQFSPTAVGLATDTLQINTDALNLSGNGTAPPPLPNYTFAGPPAPVTAMQQPAIGLSLATPYPLALTGTLTISAISNVFVVDPAVQFATGGTTVSFSIPANTTSALFGGTNSQLKLQTGTVAETITITPAFATSGGYNLTPATPTTLSMTVPSGAPVLLGAQVTAQSASGFTVTVNGYSTARSISSLAVQVTPVTSTTTTTTTSPTVTLSSAQFTIDTTSSFGAWYQSASSTAYGSLFAVDIPITLQGTIQTGSSFTNYIQSVTVTASNINGLSNSVSASLVH